MCEQGNAGILRMWEYLFDNILSSYPMIISTDKVWRFIKIFIRLQGNFELVKL